MSPSTCHFSSTLSPTRRDGEVSGAAPPREAGEEPDSFRRSGWVSVRARNRLTIIHKLGVGGGCLTAQHVAAHQQEDDAAEELVGFSESRLGRPPPCGRAAVGIGTDRDPPQPQHRAIPQCSLSSPQKRAGSEKPRGEIFAQSFAHDPCQPAQTGRVLNPASTTHLVRKSAAGAPARGRQGGGSGRRPPTEERGLAEGTRPW